MFDQYWLLFCTCLILSKLSSSLLSLMVTGLDTMFSAKSITACTVGWWTEKMRRKDWNLVISSREKQHLAIRPQILVNPDALILMSLKVDRVSYHNFIMPTCVAIITSASSSTKTVILLRSKNRNLRLQSSTCSLWQSRDFQKVWTTFPGVPMMMLSVILDPLATSSPLTAYLGIKNKKLVY